DAVGVVSNFSNYGRTAVDVMAPGGKILSAVLNGKWDRLSGTSMASPMVAGVAALIKSKSPDMDIHTLRNAVLNAVTFHESFVKTSATHGEINAYKAVSQLEEGFQVWPSNMTIAGEDSY